MHYAVPVALASRGLLARLFTDIYCPFTAPNLLARCVPKEIARFLARRASGLPFHSVTSFPLLGLQYYARARRCHSGSERLQAYLWGSSRFNEAVIRHGLRRANVIYAYNSTALELFLHARETGRTRILERTIAPKIVEKQILEVERESWIGWDAELEDSDLIQSFADRESHEWALADLILCGSDFVRGRLIAQGVRPQLVRVVPYGVEPRAPVRAVKQSGRLQVLFVGAVGLRKGVPYLLEAARLLRDEPIDFRLVGALPRDRRGIANAPPNVVFTGPKTRAAVREEFERADVFLLPSLCEGSATVCYEALAAGMPVITTINAGSVVRDTQDGYIVPIRDGHAIASRLRALAQSRELLASMSECAREHSRHFSITEYGENVIHAMEALTAGEARERCGSCC